MTNTTIPATGHVTAVRKTGATYAVDVEVISNSIGKTAFTVNVNGPINSAVDQARAVLLALGHELVHGFDPSASLK